jgi:uncharacterized protein (DUF2141 family)
MLLFAGSLYAGNQKEVYSLKIKVGGLRNSTGVVQFALYNKDGSIPDKHYQKYFKKKTAGIKNGFSQTTFKNLPAGTYAVNILHDENRDGQIEKKFIKPTEGIGFSNYSSIGLSNRPNFKKASFLLNADTVKKIKIIYL